MAHPPPLPPPLPGPPPHQLKSASSLHRPPLPPVPDHYRAQAAAEQLQRRSPHQPILPPFPPLTSDNLRRIELHPHPHSHPHPHPHPHPPRSLSSTPHRVPSHHPSAPSFLPPPPPPHLARPLSHQQLNFYPPPPLSDPLTPIHPTPSSPPPIALPIIDLELLSHLYQRHFKLVPDPASQVLWASKVLKFIERSQAIRPTHNNNNNNNNNNNTSSLKPPESSTISDPLLVKYTDVALKTVIRLAESNPTLPNGGAQALYLRGDLYSTGAFPSYRTKDPMLAFRDFEAAAQLGYHLAWFRIGREYETCEDWDRATAAYHQGLSLDECACVYRLGMCHLLGEINLPVDLRQAISYLSRAAQLANEETPQPAYVYGMILAGEFESLPQIPPEILPPNLIESKLMIEKAAYLGFAPAQYKMGWCYEYSQLSCRFDPLLSVEYYSLASKQGESEADMALSKWFLCGADGHFGPNESMAFSFAEKASRRGLGSAMFAIGYYLEVGIGGRQDSQAALEWYQRAWQETGNEDAKERLTNLGKGGIMLSRQEHEQHLDQKLVRKHTLAAQRNPVDNLKPSSGLRRRETMKKVEEARLAQPNLSSPHPTTLSGPPSPSGSTTPSSPSAYSPTAIGSHHLTMPIAHPNGRVERGYFSQPPTPTHPSGPHRPSLDPSLSLESSQLPRASQPARMVNRLNAYQLTDDGPSLGAPLRTPSSTRRKVDHITTAPPVETAPKTQFNSFADMGIQTAKAKKAEECIIV